MDELDHFALIVCYVAVGLLLIFSVSILIWFVLNQIKTAKLEAERKGHSIPLPEEAIRELRARIKEKDRLFFQELNRQKQGN